MSGGAEADARAGGVATGPAAGDDAVLPFHLDRLDMRGRVVRLDATLDRILSQHAYPPSVGALVAEAALLTALIGQAMKLRGRFSIQARAEDAAAPVALVATDYFAPRAEGEVGRLRAYAHFSAERTPQTSPDPASLIGTGFFAMIIDQGPHMEPYKGVTPLIEGGLAASAETYFAQSEQVATRFQLAVGQEESPGGGEAAWRGGGVMLQHLARVGEHVDEASARGVSGREAAEQGAQRLMRAEDVAALDGSEDAWRSAVMKLDTVEMMELIGPHVSPERLLLRLFHEDEPRVFPAQPVAFGCTCSAAKVETLLKSYPVGEIADMAEDGVIRADCQFCGARYEFPLETLGD
ncbi:MAG: Hsp33 family molecular chaperone HslO [Pseudomonadota bacterium]